LELAKLQFILNLRREFIYFSLDNNDDKNPVLILLHLLHVEGLRKIIFNRWNYGLDKLKENDEVHVHSKISASFLNGLDNFNHDLSMSAKIRHKLTPLT